MGSESIGSKSRLRREMRAVMRHLTDHQRASGSARAASLLERQAAWRNAGSILFYAPLADEPDLWPLLRDTIAAGKSAALPRFDAATGHYTASRIQDLAADLVAGRFGIREPAAHCPAAPLNRLDLVLVPGVAFDLRGRRLGRGKGFYDRLLASARGKTCGVAFDEQIVGSIPVEPHDVHVNCILTPTRWIEL